MYEKTSETLKRLRMQEDIGEDVEAYRESKVGEVIERYRDSYRKI